ncbi:hypothetical protein BSL78_13729 [Apostichopus japonicus]|uniref:SH3 domain-containing protein n=1 Tax=Stichopus japonicus TaxID=307972 RepID=A0A2G8KMZ0_STIJA|nr:hypothetical protein BSL78_13729 [Apostichopus japonicus]
MLEMKQCSLQKQLHTYLRISRCTLLSSHVIDKSLHVPWGGGERSGGGDRPASPEEEQNDFEYDAEEEQEDFASKPGVQVKALYDYDGVEEDELSFHTGDIFVKLEDEDEQGWCKGRVNDKVGLYPANYATPI